VCRDQNAGKFPGKFGKISEKKRFFSQIARKYGKIEEYSNITFPKKLTKEIF